MGHAAARALTARDAGTPGAGERSGFMVWDRGEIYVCSNPDCGLEVVVNRASRHARAGPWTVVCLCGSPLQKKVA